MRAQTVKCFTALLYVARPGQYLQSGMLYRFPETEVVVEILQAAEEGVVEVDCYLEYVQ